MKQPIDPIAEAWKQLHREPLPLVLSRSPIVLAGEAQAAKNQKRRGKHTLPVCV